MSHSSDHNFGNSVSALIAVALVVTLVFALTAGRFEQREVTASPQVLAERLAPVGKVNTNAAAVAAAAPAPAAQATADPGQAIYNRVCHACHATGAAGAPLLGNKEAWQPRIDTGIDALLHSAINGKNAMPPRGTCTDCSDDDLKAAIQYMISQVK